MRNRSHRFNRGAGAGGGAVAAGAAGGGAGGGGAGNERVAAQMNAELKKLQALPAVAFELKCAAFLEENSVSNFLFCSATPSAPVPALSNFFHEVNVASTRAF